MSPIKVPQRNLVKTENASLLAYNKIKELILQNRLEPQKNLNDERFSKQFHMSRTPVREALIMLEKDGLLTREDGRGFYLKPFRVKDIQDLYEFRELIEMAAAEIIISRATEQRLEPLSKILDQIDMAKPEDAETIMNNSLEFHLRFIEVCDNSLIIESMRNCLEKSVRISWAFKEQAVSRLELEEHRKMLSFLKTRDVKGLQKLTHQHISRAKETALTFIKSNLEKLYFIP